VSDLPDPPPLTIQTTASITAHAAVTARATVTPFRTRLVEACNAALERLEAKSGPEHNIFAETGEVLFWLHALGDDGDGVNRLSPGLQWARHQYAHGNLLTEAVEFDHGATLGHFVVGSTALDTPPHYRCMPRTTIGINAKARRGTALEQAYDNDVARHPVVARLRLELSRLA
jgi:hypothetical protein